MIRKAFRLFFFITTALPMFFGMFIVWLFCLAFGITTSAFSIAVWLAVVLPLQLVYAGSCFAMTDKTDEFKHIGKSFVMFLDLMDLFKYVILPPFFTFCGYVVSKLQS